MKKIFLRSFQYLSFILLTISAGFSSQPEVRRINPPKLEKAHIGDKILCHRPMRRGSPALRIERVGKRYIAHNYGHGGSGWTLAPGSASYVLDLLQQQAGSNLKPESEIIIVGAGVLGLLTALDLVERGYKKILIIAERFENLTSHKAGGLLAPVSMNNHPEMQKTLNKIGFEAYRFYEKIAKGQHPTLKKGAVIVPAYFRTREESGLEPYVGVVMKPAKDVILDFGNGTQQPMVAYDDGIFIDTGTLMTSLRQALEGKVTFRQQKVKDFQEISSQFVINCAGLGAKELTKDTKMVSVQGHLIMLKDQNPSDLQHMILVYFTEEKTQSGLKVKRSFYIFPKHLPGRPTGDIGVIGGTFIEDADDQNPNNEEFDILLKGAKDFYGLKN